MQIEISDAFQKDYEVTSELQVPTKDSDFNYHDYIVDTQILKKC